MKLSIFGLALIISTIVSAKDLNLCFYDIDKNKTGTENRIRQISKNLQDSEADIIIMAGVKDEQELQQIKSPLKNFIYSQLVNGEDKNSHLAYLSKQKPYEFKAVSDLQYIIKAGIKLRVQHGFIHAIFNQNGYFLHIFGADLKNREKHPIYNQTDMRRYEARQLRGLINSVLKKDPEANILILGNLNDTCGKSPIKDIYNRRFGIEKRLLDLRPLDKMNVSWTFLSHERDEYERIDYAIASSHLIPEVMFNKNRIISTKKGGNASSHRPIQISISCQDRPLWTKEKINLVFPNTIRDPAYNSPPIKP